MNTEQSAKAMAPRTLAAVVLCAVAIAGALAGAAIDRMTLHMDHRAATIPDTAYHPLSAILRSPTDVERRHLRAQLADALALTTVQARAVDSILDAHAAEFRALRDEIRPRVESLTVAVRSDVERVLTAAQRAQYRALLGAPTSPDSGARQASR